LPVGVQLVSRTGNEAGLFSLARKLDTALAAYRPPANFGY
jgi:Asp-tRNA(Asn)/Glu-tRNA(Gln) amidotransferase A subunit family amidase